MFGLNGSVVVLLQDLGMVVGIRGEGMEFGLLEECTVTKSLNLDQNICLF